MARIRSLKPSFFKNEQLAELSFAHRLCYEGLWCYADRDGRLEDRPMRLKAEIFPYDLVDMEQLLSDLCTAGFIQRYRSGTVAVIAIPTFSKHQVPKRDERASVLPAYSCENGNGSDAVPPLDGGCTAAVPPVGQGEVGSRTEDIGTGEVGAAAPPPARPPSPSVLQELWNDVTAEPIPRCREMTPKRTKHAGARLRERSVDEWRAVFQRIAASAFCRGHNDRQWVATFDWVVESPDTAVKVLEGKYDDRRVSQSGRELAITPKERERATQARRAWGRCRHDPTCATFAECVAMIIQGWRESEAEAS